MTVSAFASGTQVASIGTEHFLSSPNAAGVYTLHVDTQAMASGDTLELRAYQMVLSGGTSRVALFKSFSGAQPADDYIQISDPIGNELTDANALRFSLKQTAGSGRSYPWKVLQYS